MPPEWYGHGSRSHFLGETHLDCEVLAHRDAQVCQSHSPLLPQTMEVTTLDKDGICAHRSVRGLDCRTAATGHLKVADIAMSTAEAASAALPHPTDRRPPR